MFAKIPYNQGTGYRLINLSQVEKIDVNTRANTCQLSMKSKEKVLLAGKESMELLMAISEYNKLARTLLILGLTETFEKEEF